MKKLILLAVLSASTVSFGACNIELSVKKAGAKTAYAGDTSVSTKVQAGLESIGCVITKKVLNKAEVIYTKSKFKSFWF
jgi:hypothetical protein